MYIVRIVGLPKFFAERLVMKIILMVFIGVIVIGGVLGFRNMQVQQISDQEEILIDAKFDFSQIVVLTKNFVANNTELHDLITETYDHIIGELHQLGSQIAPEFREELEQIEGIVSNSFDISFNSSKDKNLKTEVDKQFNSLGEFNSAVDSIFRILSQWKTPWLNGSGGTTFHLKFYKVHEVVASVVGIQEDYSIAAGEKFSFNDRAKISFDGMVNLTVSYLLDYLTALNGTTDPEIQSILNDFASLKAYLEDLSGDFSPLSNDVASWLGVDPTTDVEGLNAIPILNQIISKIDEDFSILVSKNASIYEPALILDSNTNPISASLLLLLYQQLINVHGATMIDAIAFIYPVLVNLDISFSRFTTRVDQLINALNSELISVTFPIIVLIVLTLLVIVFVFILNRDLIGPIRTLETDANEINNGNLAIELKQWPQVDEIGQLGRAFNEMVKSLRQLTSRLQMSASSVQETSQMLNIVTKETSDNTTQITNTMQQITHGASEQVQMVNRVMDRVLQFEQVTSQILADVSKTLETIVKISLQTNVLALNAGVEASRAGESGRGFAVVAANMRTLSDRVKETTNEVRKLSESIRDQLNDLVQSLENELNNVLSVSEEQASATEEVTASVEEISSQVQTISQTMTDLNDLISKSFEEVSSLKTE
ncbi:MAG: methyl-accepting chemotaxis protein [Methanobacteriota archaeon]|nr:MAG: methyl-accepting chemotaxis protein [Euryarchaeota archaeon]